MHCFWASKWSLVYGKTPLGRQTGAEQIQHAPANDRASEQAAERAGDLVAQWKRRRRSELVCGRHAQNPDGGGMDGVALTQFAWFWSPNVQVETVKAERDAIESELKSATTDMKDKFLLALAKDGQINEPPLSYQALGQAYGPLQKQVAESLAKQKGLVDQIRVSDLDLPKNCSNWEKN